MVFGPYFFISILIKYAFLYILRAILLHLDPLNVYLGFILKKLCPLKVVVFRVVLGNGQHFDAPDREGRLWARKGQMTRGMAIVHFCFVYTLCGGDVHSMCL